MNQGFEFITLKSIVPCGDKLFVTFIIITSIYDLNTLDDIWKYFPTGDFFELTRDIVMYSTFSIPIRTPRDRRGLCFPITPPPTKYMEEKP